MVKVVYNADYGGFSLTDKQQARYEELSGKKLPLYYYDKLERTDPHLVQVVEELGRHDLKIRDIPKGSKYRIDEYDGSETVVLIDEYDWQTA